MREPVLASELPRRAADFPRMWGAFTLYLEVFAAPSHRSDLTGLFLAGDTVFPGQGTLSVTISGFNAARTAARCLAQRTHRLSQPIKEATL